MPHRRSREAQEMRWQSHLEFLRRQALNTAYFDRELSEVVATTRTTYYPGMEPGEVLADSRGRGSFQQLH